MMVRVLNVWVAILFLAFTARSQVAGSSYAVQCNVGISVFTGAKMTHGSVSCSFRAPFTDHWAFQPEVQYLWSGGGHRDVVLSPLGFSIDFRRTLAKVRPYAVVGLGGIATWTPNMKTRWSPYGDLGGGLKLFVSDRQYVAPEIRRGADMRSGLWRITAAGGSGFD
jgi:hypothetical protein